MNILSAHQSSSPICPATQSVCLWTETPDAQLPWLKPKGST
jgi:hypothetical protein